MIVLCGDTYGLLGTSLGEAAPDAIISTESQGDEVTQAFITLGAAHSDPRRAQAQRSGREVAR